MNENINLVEILKDCPKGTKLYSPLFGEVEFGNINETVCPITVHAYSNNNDELCLINHFDSEGKYYTRFKESECMLFPSKDQRDWSKWKCPKPKFDPKTLQPFDRVLVRCHDNSDWFCNVFSHIEPYGDFCFCVNDTSYKMCIPYNEDTKHLVGASEEAPEYYKYWED